MFDEIVQLVIFHWKKAYKISPVVTTVVTVVAVAGIATGIYLTEKNQRLAQEEKRRENQNYARQIDSLNQIRGSLQDLIQFVDSQREQLKQSEYSLASLKSEHDQLKPVVEADRRVIDAIFTAQETRNKEAQSRERWIGFGFGVIASLVASFLWALVSALFKKRRKDTSGTIPV